MKIDSKRPLPSPILTDAGDHDPHVSTSTKVTALFGCLAAIVWYLLWCFAHTDLTVRQRSAQITFYILAMVVFAVGATLVWRFGYRLQRRVVWFIVVSGIVLRLTLAPVGPVTTVDVYRYLWEGRLVTLGVNPYLHAPNSPELEQLRDWVWPHIIFRTVPAAYPPVAQYVFALAASIPTNRIVTIKLLFAMFDIGTLLLLTGLLIQLRKPPGWILLYAWHPLVVGEVVVRGHFDSVGIFYLILAARLLLLAKPYGRVLAGAALAASIMGKGYAGIVLPFFLVAARPHRWWFFVAVGGVSAAVCLPFASAGQDLFRGMTLYIQYWHGYASIFPVVERVVAGLVEHPAIAERRICGVLLAVWIMVLFLRQRRNDDPAAPFDTSFLALAGFYLLSPVVYPWYLAWTIPFLSLRIRPIWLLFTGTIYAFYAHPLFAPKGEVWWLTVLQYGLPLTVGGILSGIHWRRQRIARLEVNLPDPSTSVSSPSR